MTVIQQIRFPKGGVEIVPTKSSNIRKIFPAKIAMDALRDKKKKQ